MEREIELAKKTVEDVRHILVSEPILARPEQPLRDILQEMVNDLRVRHVYVVDDEKHLIGVIRMNALVAALFPFSSVLEMGNEVVCMRFPITTPDTAADIMMRDAVSVTFTTTLAEVAQLFLREKINELPVVDRDRRVVGQINFHEIIVAYLRETEPATKEEA